MPCFIEEDTQDKGKLYKPVTKVPALNDLKPAATFKQEAKDAKDKALQKKEKKKSNLELFKEELRA